SDMRGDLVRSIAAGLALWPLVAQTASVPQCLQKAIRAAGKEVSARLGCRSRVAATNDPSTLASCEAHASARYLDAASRLPCFWHATTCDGKAAACAAWVAAVMSDAPSTCETAKQRAAAHLVERELGCYAPPTGSGPPPSDSCLAKARAKFAAAIANAGPCADGGAPQALVESVCVDALAAHQGS